jgi:hypothetical protein
VQQNASLWCGRVEFNPSLVESAIVEFPCKQYPLAVGPALIQRLHLFDERSRLKLCSDFNLRSLSHDREAGMLVGYTGFFGSNLLFIRIPSNSSNICGYSEATSSNIPVCACAIIGRFATVLHEIFIEAVSEGF